MRRARLAASVAVVVVAGSRRLSCTRPAAAKRRAQAGGVLQDTVVEPAYAIGGTAEAAGLPRCGAAASAGRRPHRAAAERPGLLGVSARTHDGTTMIVQVVDRSHGWLRVRYPAARTTPPAGSAGRWPARSSRSMTRLVSTGRGSHCRCTGAAGWCSGRVGVGTASTPTPSGSFYILDVVRFQSPAYGPVAFGTSGRSPQLTDWPGGGVVGIHGTDQPGLIPGRISHGCIRLRNADILRLSRILRRHPSGDPMRLPAAIAITGRAAAAVTGGGEGRSKAVVEIVPARPSATDRPPERAGADPAGAPNTSRTHRGIARAPAGPVPTIVDRQHARPRRLRRARDQLLVAMIAVLASPRLSTAACPNDR